MERPRAYSKRDAAVGLKIKEDSYLTKIVKYIPSEIVFAYVAIVEILLSVDPIKSSPLPFWLVFSFLLILTPSWILGTAKRNGLPKPWFQAVTGIIAFTCWALAIGTSPNPVRWQEPAYGSAVLILVTLLIPVAENFFVKPTEVQP